MIFKQLNRIFGSNIPETATEKEIDAILADIAPISEQLNTNTENQTATAELVEGLQANVATLASANEALASKLNGIEDALTAKVNAIVETATTAFDAKVAEVGTAVNEVKTLTNAAPPKTQEPILKDKPKTDDKNIISATWIDDMLNGKISL